jgi:hypothetical protein
MMMTQHSVIRLSCTCSDGNGLDPKKCLFPVTCPKNYGSVGPKFVSHVTSGSTAKYGEVAGLRM